MPLQKESIESGDINSYFNIHMKEGTESSTGPHAAASAHD